MKITRVGASAALILALGLTACANNEGTKTGDSTGAKLQGQLKGIGASSMGKAQTNWISEFQKANPDVTINYAPEGSGAGRTAFSGGGADFAGSDRAFKDEEMAADKFASSKCKEGTQPLNIPVFLSPIAIAYNVEGVTDLQLTAEVTAGIFSGKINKWNDPKIVAINPSAKLPDANITPVHRSDDSGTTENFADTLSKLAPTAWDQKVSGVFPESYKGEGAKGTSGLVETVKNGKNTIGYADAGQIGDLKAAKFSSDGKEFFAPTHEAALKVVNASPVAEGRKENDLALKLDRKAAGYPVILVSYGLVCSEYKDAANGKLVKAYFSTIVSEAGQKLAESKAGASAIGGDLHTKIVKAIEAVK